MSFIPGYDYDIFISYAHVDNEPFSGQTTGWIKLFYEDLKPDACQAFWPHGYGKVLVGQ